MSWQGSGSSFGNLKKAGSLDPQDRYILSPHEVDARSVERGPNASPEDVMKQTMWEPWGRESGFRHADENIYFGDADAAYRDFPGFGMGMAARNAAEDGLPAAAPGALKHLGSLSGDSGRLFPSHRLNDILDMSADEIRDLRMKGATQNSLDTTKALDSLAWILGLDD